MQIQPLSRMKTLNGPRVRGISPVGEEKGCGGKHLPDRQYKMLSYRGETALQGAL